MDGENYQAMSVCDRAAAWDKPRSEMAAVGRCRVASGKMMSAAFCRKPLRPIGNENPSRDGDWSEWTFIFASKALRRKKTIVQLLLYNFYLLHFWKFFGLSKTSNNNLRRCPANIFSHWCNRLENFFMPFQDFPFFRNKLLYNTTLKEFGDLWLKLYQEPRQLFSSRHFSNTLHQAQLNPLPCLA